MDPLKINKLGRKRKQHEEQVAHAVAHVQRVATKGASSKGAEDERAKSHGMRDQSVCVCLCAQACALACVCASACTA